MPHLRNMTVATKATYPGDDEDYLTRILPQQLGAHASAVSAALAVHFSFYPQVPCLPCCACGGVGWGGACAACLPAVWGRGETKRGKVARQQALTAATRGLPCHPATAGMQRAAAWWRLCGTPCHGSHVGRPTTCLEDAVGARAAMLYATQCQAC